MWSLKTDLTIVKKTEGLKGIKYHIHSVPLSELIQQMTN